MRRPMSCEALREAVETWPELDRLRQLRAVILWWPYGNHEQWCAIRADTPCDCGWAKANEARRVARQLVGWDPDD